MLFCLLSVSITRQRKYLVVFPLNLHVLSLSHVRVKYTEIPNTHIYPFTLLHSKKFTKTSISCNGLASCPGCVIYPRHEYILCSVQVRTKFTEFGIYTFTETLPYTYLYVYMDKSGWREKCGFVLGYPINNVIPFILIIYQDFELANFSFPVKYALHHFLQCSSTLSRRLAKPLFQNSVVRDVKHPPIPF